VSRDLPSVHPAVTPNEVLRFGLELAALGAIGYGGWVLGGGGLTGGAVALGAAFIAAAIWGTFRVDGDPKRAPVPVPGTIRLLLEGVSFASACALLALASAPVPAAVLGGLVVVHYAVGHQRIRWLLAHPGRLPAYRR
jgi:hypothetical protein